MAISNRHEDNCTCEFCFADTETSLRKFRVLPYSDQIDYPTYINSNAWIQKSEEAKRRAGYRCQVCNRSSREAVLDAHHRTYERLGHERPEDITVLCRDCHELYETNRIKTR